MSVDPLLVPWPKKWVNDPDPEVRLFIAWFNRFLTDLRGDGEVESLSSLQSSLETGNISIESNAANIAINAQNIDANSDQLTVLNNDVSSVNTSITQINTNIEQVEDRLWLSI